MDAWMHRYIRDAWDAWMQRYIRDLATGTQKGTGLLIPFEK